VLGTSPPWEAKDGSGICPKSGHLPENENRSSSSIWAAQGLTIGWQNASAILESVGLEGTSRKRCEELSKACCRRSVPGRDRHKPDLLILDEPFSVWTGEFRLLRELVWRNTSGARRFLFSTHVMPTQKSFATKRHHDPSSGKYWMNGSRDSTAVRSRRIHSNLSITSMYLPPGAFSRRANRAAPMHSTTSFCQGTNPKDAMRDIIQAVTPARIELSRHGWRDVFINSSRWKARSGTTDNQLQRRPPNEKSHPGSNPGIHRNGVDRAFRHRTADMPRRSHCLPRRAASVRISGTFRRGQVRLIDPTGWSRLSCARYGARQITARAVRGAARRWRKRCSVRDWADIRRTSGTNRSWTSRIFKSRASVRRGHSGGESLLLQESKQSKHLVWL